MEMPRLQRLRNAKDTAYRVFRNAAYAKDTAYRMFRNATYAKDAANLLYEDALTAYNDACDAYDRRLGKTKQKVKAAGGKMKK